METYSIRDGNKTKVVKGINLEDALIKTGYTNIQIVPLWRGKSNGKYKVYCSESAIVLCTWIEKIKRLANKT